MLLLPVNMPALRKTIAVREQKLSHLVTIAFYAFKKK